MSFQQDCARFGDQPARLADGHMLGTIDSARARSQVHPGALYLHQSESFVVDELNLEDGRALCHPEVPE